MSMTRMFLHGRVYIWTDVVHRVCVCVCVRVCVRVRVRVCVCRIRSDSNASGNTGRSSPGKQTTSSNSQGLSGITF